MKRQHLPMIVLALAVVCLLAIAHPIFAAEPVIQSEPNIYFIRLQPQPAARANLADGFRASYERLEPALFELMADGKVVSFEFLPEIGAVRVIAIAEGIQPLAARPEVAGIVPLHPRRIAPQADVPAAEPAAPEGPAAADILPIEPSGPGATYTVSGIVRDYDGTLVQDALSNYCL